MTARLVALRTRDAALSSPPPPFPPELSPEVSIAGSPAVCTNLLTPLLPLLPPLLRVREVASLLLVLMARAVLRAVRRPTEFEEGGAGGCGSPLVGGLGGGWTAGQRPRRSVHRR
jgi:hypothetical protein